MGVLDFDSVFDILDPARKGFLTTDQVFQFDQTIHFTPLGWDQTKAAVQYVCGSNSDGRIERKHFVQAKFQQFSIMVNVQLLHELERRRTLEEKVRWDFMALDKTGNNCVPIEDTLVLFKLTHEDKFSLRTWGRFLASREDELMDVYWDEVKLWLCAIPNETPSNDAEIAHERERLLQAREKNASNEYQRFIETKDDDRLSAIERKEYKEKTKRLARRKFNRWEEEGVEGVIFDDGKDRGEVVPMMAKHYLGLNDLIDALDTKYDLLRKALFHDMLLDEYGETVWNGMSHAEKMEAYQTLQTEEKQMRLNGTLSSKGIGLYGARVSQNRTLKGLMGGLTDMDAEKKEVNERRTMFKDRGLTEIQIDNMLRIEFTKQEQGPVDSLSLLIALAERQQDEKEILLSYKKSDHKNKLSSAQVVTEYCRLLHEHHLADLEKGHVAATTAVALAERDQMFRPERFVADRERQESLAKERLVNFDPNNISVPWEEGEGAKNKSLGEIDLQVDAVKEITWKHALERIILIQLLQGNDSKAAKAAGKQMNAEQWTSRMSALRNLRNAWRDSSAVFMKSQRQHHFKIIQEGVGIYHAMKTSEREMRKQSVDDAEINAAVLADLQEKQYQEMTQTLLHMQNMSDKDLSSVRKSHRNARQQEHLDNIAAVLLGTFEVSDEEKPYLDALDFKYQALRTLLLRHELHLEHGIGWERLSEKEQSKLLNKKLADELKLRTDGKMADMVALLTRMPPDIGSVRSLMGEDKAEFTKRIARVYSRQDGSSDPNDPDADEVPHNKVKSQNLLADLQRRFYAEQDCLIGQLKSHDSLNLTEQEKLLHLVLLKVETKKAMREEHFGQGALNIGLFERVISALESRHKSDKERQSKLARLRYDSRKKRIELGKSHHPEVDDYARPEKSDICGWMEACLREIDKKHVEEREILLSVLQDPSMEDLCEVANAQSTEDLQKRLTEVKAKRKLMDMDKSDEREENVSIIEEAAAIKMILKQRLLHESKSLDKTLINEDISIALLCELQDEQDREMAEAISQITKKNQAEMKIIREYEINSRHWRAGENVILVLTKYEGSANDDELVKALDEKYELLEDKLLEEEIKDVDDKEKQSQLCELKRKARRLHAQGDVEELAGLLSSSQRSEADLREMLGCVRADFIRQRRQYDDKKAKQGEEGPGWLEEESSNDKFTALISLLNRQEREKKMLFSDLEGAGGIYMSWRERQEDLLRYLWQVHMARSEGDTARTLLSVGMAERQTNQHSVRMKNDRERQQKLAGLRYSETKKKSAKPAYSNNIVKDGSLTAIQLAVLKRLHDRQLMEREFLFELSASKPDQQLKDIAVNSSEAEREERLQHIGQRREAVRRHPEKTKDNRAVMLEAFTIRAESCRHSLSTEGSNASDDEVVVSLLSRLQDKHNMEAEQWIHKVADKNQQDLVNLQVQLLSEIKLQVADILAFVLLSLDEGQDTCDLDSVMKALDSKYDTLRDKLIAEVLINQLGEAAWKKMSEQERQRRKAELRLKEKQLRAEGRFEEAAALFGESLKHHELLEGMLGASREDQERRLKERLEKRRKRLAEGMSEEECDAIEKQEDEEEKKKRNILLDLQNNFDKEKAELLARLQSHHDQLSAEQRRQLELARLRREQRRARQEEKFDAAALLLGLAKEQEKALEDKRRNQEKLARSRLEARLAKMRGKAGQAGLAVVEAAADLPSDRLGLQEALIQEIEKKHDEERDLLMQLFVDPQTEKETALAVNMSEEQLQASLSVLSQARQKWKDDNQSKPQDQLNILTKATARSLELLKKRKERVQTGADPQVALLADLQQLQDDEAKHLLSHLQDKPDDALKQIHMVQSAARQQHWYDNVAKVTLRGSKTLFSDDDFTSEESELINALDKKYDTLRDKLLAEALMQQLGEAQWKKLSEQERQNRLAKLRMEEQRLRREGKYDEAALLLGALQQDEADLLKKLGTSQTEQKQRVAARLKRKRELLADRERQNLSTDDNIIDALLDQEEHMLAQEQEQPKRNILEGLQNRYEDEKAALLASLRDHDSRLSSERLRQLELAKLRREEKRLAQESKFDAVALLLNDAKNHGEMIESSLVKQRESQKELARQRLAARKHKKQGQGDGHDAKVKQELNDLETNNDMREALLETKIAEDGIVALQENILELTERRQESETLMLEDLVLGAAKDTASKQFADSTDAVQVRVQLEKLRQDHSRWRNRSRMQAAVAAAGSSGNQLQNTIKTLASRQEQYQLLAKAVALRLKAEKEKGEVKSGTIEEELLVNMLADLQQVQGAESRALYTAMEQQDMEMLRNMRQGVLVGVREGWYENLPRVVFNITDTEQTEELDGSALTKEMEQEFTQEKNDLKQKLAQQGDGVDVEGTMARLEAEQAARRKALEAAISRHKQVAEDRLAAKRIARENREFEQSTAVELLKQADRQSSFIKEQRGAQQSRQNELMQHKLIARREERLRAKKAEGLLTPAGSASPSDSRPSTADSMALPPGMRVKREGSALDMAMSDDQKNEMYMQLVREQTIVNRRLSMEHRRHQDRLKSRLNDMKEKKVSEASALIALGERQKTTLEKQRKEEQEKQISATKERVARLRYEKTMTMKEKGDQSAKKFEQMVDSKDGSEDDKMTKAARKIEDNLKRGAVGIHRDKTVEEDDEGLTEKVTSPQSTGQDKMKTLRARMEQRKQKRQKAKGDQ